MGGNFRKNLRNELDYQKMTVKELAVKASVAKGALDCYLGKQESMPPADVAVRIAKALGVSVEYLVDSSQEQEASPPPTVLGVRKREILDVFDALDKNNQKFLIEFARLLKKQYPTP